MTEYSRNAPCHCGSGLKYKKCHGLAIYEDNKPVAEPDAPVLKEMAPRHEINQPAIVALMPTRGRPTIETLISFANFDGFHRVLIPKPRAGIIEARNALAIAAPKFPDHATFIPKMGWYVLWIDDDAFWLPGTMSKLIKALQLPGVDIIAGWFTGRSARAAAKAFRSDGTQPRPGKIGDCEEGDVVEVDRVGFHLVMHRLDVIHKMHDAYGENLFSPEGTNELGEDMAFCRRARALGLRIWAHTGCPVAHIDDDGVAYLPGEGPMEVQGSNLTKIEDIRNYGDLDQLTKEQISGGMVMAEGKEVLVERSTRGS